MPDLGVKVYFWGIISGSALTVFYENCESKGKLFLLLLMECLHRCSIVPPHEPRQANLCLRAFRHDKF